MSSQASGFGHVKSSLTPMISDGFMASRAMRLEFIENFDYSPIRRDLAKDLGWNEEKIAEVERKAKAFFSCFLVANEGSFLSPDEEIDQFWHPFILRTKLYREFCEKAFGRFIDHQPEEDPIRLADWFANTRQCHIQVFGKDLVLKGEATTCFGGSCGGGGGGGN